MYALLIANVMASVFMWRKYVTDKIQISYKFICGQYLV